MEEIKKEVVAVTPAENATVEKTFKQDEVESMIKERLSKTHAELDALKKYEADSKATLEKLTKDYEELKATATKVAEQTKLNISHTVNQSQDTPVEKNEMFEALKRAQGLI